MKFSSTQIALMSRLLDEVVDAHARNRWLENFKLARAAQHYVW
jgi:hypothetical protein